MRAFIPKGVRSITGGLLHGVFPPMIVNPLHTLPSHVIGRFLVLLLDRIASRQHKRNYHASSTPKQGTGRRSTPSYCKYCVVSTSCLRLLTVFQVPAQSWPIERPRSPVFAPAGDTHPCQVSRPHATSSQGSRPMTTAVCDLVRTGHRMNELGLHPVDTKPVASVALRCVAPSTGSLNHRLLNDHNSTLLQSSHRKKQSTLSVRYQQDTYCL